MPRLPHNRRPPRTKWHRQKKSTRKNAPVVIKTTARAAKPRLTERTINAKNLTSEKMKKEPDAEYIEAIEKGFPDDGMPAFKGKLTDQEIKDVVAYIRKELQK